jgi:hypothetical protein
VSCRKHPKEEDVVVCCGCRREDDADTHAAGKLEGIEAVLALVSEPNEVKSIRALLQTEARGETGEEQWCAVNKHDLAKVLRRLLDQGCKEGAHIPSAELRSLVEWLKSWGDGPNWYDQTGRYVPMAPATRNRLVAAYGDF